jgi:arylsulfatase A-like enzyme
MDTLGSLGLTDNTMIIFLSDHGEEFYDHYSEEDLIPKYTEPLVPQISIVDHAHSLYEELIRVPLIMRIPGIKPTEQRIENQVRLIDVAPTILDCLNIKAAAGFQGVSLLSLIKSGKRDADPPAISEFLQMGPERKSVRKDAFKYIWIEHPDLCWNFNFRNINQKELFDLRADPKEQRNLSAQNAQMVEQCQRMLEAQQSDSRAIHEKLQRLYGSQKDSPRKIDKDVAEQLKGLGYLN